MYGYIHGEGEGGVDGDEDGDDGALEDGWTRKYVKIEDSVPQRILVRTSVAAAAPLSYCSAVWQYDEALSLESVAAQLL